MSSRLVGGNLVFTLLSSLLAVACASTTAAQPQATSTLTPPATTIPARMPVPHSNRVKHDRSYPRSRTPVPILMYHALGEPPASAPYPLLYTSPDVFGAQLQALRDNGYHAITLRQAWRAWHGWGPMPPHPIVITFDDGFGSVARKGLPLMEKYHWPADLFLLVDHLDQPGQWDLNDHQIARLMHADWELDAHTYTEVDLPALPAAAAWRDIHSSRLILRHRFHQPVRFFCYPVGAFDRAVIGMVRKAGYVGAVTTVDGIAGPGGDPYTMPRIRVDGDESPSELLQSIRAL